MKRRISYLLSVLCLGVLLNACGMLGGPEEFDEGLLVGTWVVDGHESDHWRFDAGGKGASWDTADDVTESEAQAFTWSLVGNTLTITHRIGMTGADAIPKAYKMMSLTEVSMSYKDESTKKVTYMTKIR
ncbi:MAG: lipocalin family protein [Paludibacteraceae bacterium]|nr:lipocalin family protein [Paludibacteraceae bacterium]